MSNSPISWDRCVSQGFGAAIGEYFVGNAVEGAVENVANTVVSGQPLTPGKLLGSAAEGAATSAATGGTMAKVHLPTAVNKLGDELTTRFEGQKVYRA